MKVGILRSGSGQQLTADWVVRGRNQRLVQNECKPHPGPTKLKADIPRR
jgi:hypothetical protein